MEMTEGSVSKTVVLTGHGGYDKVEVREYPRPSPQKGEVLVNIKANGINFAELLARQGLYPSCPKLPAVLGLEGAGDVLEVGEDVTDLKVNVLQPDELQVSLPTEIITPLQTHSNRTNYED